MKKCPYCAEEIQDEAIKCKHCGSDLKTLPHIAQASAPISDGLQQQSELPKRQPPDLAKSSPRQDIKYSSSSNLSFRKIIGYIVISLIFIMGIYATIQNHFQKSLQIAEPKEKNNKIQTEKTPDSELEAATGIRITSVNAGWDWFGGSFCPYVKIEIQNSSDHDINWIELKVSFTDTNKNELIGEANDYFVTSSPLRPGIRKSEILYSDHGYDNDVTPIKNNPNIVADLVLEIGLPGKETPYNRKIQVKKPYAGP